MVKIKISSPDLAKLRKKVDSFADKGFKEDVHESIRKVLPKIHSDAFSDCPKKSGILAASLHVGFEDDITGYIADGVFYGLFQEEGTRTIPAKHFMRNSVNHNFPSVGDEVIEKAEKRFKR